MIQSKLVPQQRATSSIRLAKKKKGNASRSNSKSNKSLVISSLSWDFEAMQPLSSPPKFPYVVTKHEFTINRKKDSLGIGLATDNGIVIVTKVAPGNLGATNGIEVNDIIVAVNDTIVKVSRDVVKLIKLHSNVKLLVYRIR